MLDVHLEAFRRLREEDWDFFINLSDDSFPLAPLAALEHFLFFHTGPPGREATGGVRFRP